MQSEGRNADIYPKTLLFSGLCLPKLFFVHVAGHGEPLFKERAVAGGRKMEKMRGGGFQCLPELVGSSFTSAAKEQGRGDCDIRAGRTNRAPNSYFQQRGLRLDALDSPVSKRLGVLKLRDHSGARFSE